MMKNYTHKNKQQGVALAIGIILLLVIAVIGVTSMKSALLQEKMAGGLARNGYADTAAYTLLVSVENYLFRLYQTNNGTQDTMCDYCQTEEVWGDKYHRFISHRDMLDGGTYPGATSLITGLSGQLHDEPRYIIYPIPIEDSGNSYSSVTVGEEGGASAGGSSGSLGDDSGTPVMDFYKIATKANDSTGNIYVLYESVFATRQN